MFAVKIKADTLVQNSMSSPKSQFHKSFNFTQIQGLILRLKTNILGVKIQIQKWIA